MSFRNPAALWLALLLIVPLVLYLLPMPRRRVPASALYLWARFLRTERYGRASERFRRVLGFALLGAILLSLVLAAAEPTVGQAPTRARGVAVLVDTSASMNAIVEGRSNLSRAAEEAGLLIDSLDAGTEIALAEAGDALRVICPLGGDAGAAARRARAIEPFDGQGNLERALAEAWRLWSDRPGMELFVFTDRPLPAGPWTQRARAWLAPAVGEAGNAGIVDIAARRVRGGRIEVAFGLANFTGSPRTMAGQVLVNAQLRGHFREADLPSGHTARQTVLLDEPAAAEIRVALAGPGDALAADDVAFAVVPALDALRVGVHWPEGHGRNDYVSAVLSALHEEGLTGQVVEAPASAAPVTVYVNEQPASWPAGGAIILHPLRSGPVAVAGLREQPVTVARQADHELLAGVDLRGLTVKGAVQADVPPWATPLVWADDGLVLVWAGQNARSRVLFVAMPVIPSGSRLPLVASFPVLMRNAFAWMLPAGEALRCGDRVGGWTSRRAGLVAGPDGRVHGFSVASAAESDLRRAAAPAAQALGRRRSLARPLVLLAAILLAVEWGLFHRRLTE